MTARDPDPSRTWLATIGTTTRLIEASDEAEAYERLVAAVAPVRGDGPARARTVPPTRDECSIRRYRPSDLGWLRDAAPHDAQIAAFVEHAEQLLRSVDAGAGTLLT